MARRSTILLAVLLSTSSLTARASARPILTAPISSEPTTPELVRARYRATVEHPVVHNTLRAATVLGLAALSAMWLKSSMTPIPAYEPHTAGVLARVAVGTMGVLFGSTAATLAAPKWMERHVWTPLRKLHGIDKAPTR
jgi:hypothetical protein